MSQRVYIPATFDLLGELDAKGGCPVRAGWGFAADPEVLANYSPEEREIIEHGAFVDASEASLRLLITGDGDSRFPQRRVVISVDLPDDQITPAREQGDTVVRLDPATIERSDVVCVHVDIAENEDATAAAMKVIDAADLGDEDAVFVVEDALDNLMAWYDISELHALVELSDEGHSREL